jgi:hypothetical protein
MDQRGGFLASVVDSEELIDSMIATLTSEHPEMFSNPTASAVEMKQAWQRWRAQLEVTP